MQANKKYYILLILISLMMTFQNCAKDVAFEAMSYDVDGLGGPSNPNLPNPPITPNLPPFFPPVGPPPGEPCVPGDKDCVQCEVTADGCMPGEPPVKCMPGDVKCIVMPPPIIPPGEKCVPGDIDCMKCEMTPEGCVPGEPPVECMPGDLNCVVVPPVVPPVEPPIIPPGDKCMPGDKDCMKCEMTPEGCVPGEPPVECMPGDLNCVVVPPVVPPVEPPIIPPGDKCMPGDKDCMKCEMTPEACVPGEPPVECMPGDLNCVVIPPVIPPGDKCMPGDKDCMKCEMTPEACVPGEPPVECRPGDANCIVVPPVVPPVEPPIIPPGDKCMPGDKDCMKCEMTPGGCIPVEPPVECMPGDTDCIVVPPVVPPVEPPGEECMPGDPKCDKLDVEFEGCDSFQELAGNKFSVPKKVEAKICYYKKLMSKVAGHTSGSNGEGLATDVVASDHCGRKTKNPLVLGDKTLEVTLNGKWKVALSGNNTNPEATMLIDNFFLIQLLRPSYYRAWGYGTKDAQFNKKYDGYVGHILVGGNSLADFTYFADGGTAKVTAINITEHIPEDAHFGIRFRALDNGCEANSSDVYMVFH